MKRMILPVLLAAAPALLAQQPPQSPPAQQPPPLPAFTEQVEVRVMDLDVVVTDSKGQPVTDLARQDFTVRVDGRPVPIDYFARVDDGTIHAPDLSTASPDRVLEVYKKGGEAFVPRHFLIYVDSGDLSPLTRNNALNQLRDFVTRLGPSDTARIVLFDRRPKELTDWTTSKETLMAAVDSMEKGVGMSRLQNEMLTLRSIDSTRSRSSRAWLAQTYTDQTATELDTMVKDMRNQLATLTPLPGKKAFLFVSGGLPSTPGYAMYTYAVGNFGSAAFASLDTRRVGDQIADLARQANSDEITFYTVDAQGLTAGGASASNDDPLAMRANVSFIARQDAQSGMLELASQTGGLALINSNDFSKGFSRVYQDVSSYYSVGVNLSALPAAGYQKIDLAVSRPGATVRYRRGYAPRSSDDRARDAARAALKTSVSYSAFPVKLQIGVAAKAKKQYDQPITVLIPATALTFLPAGESAKADAEIFVGVVDESGRTSDIGKEEAAFTQPAQPVQEAALAYPITLQMRKGNSRIVVNVRDKATGKMGTARADVHIE
ncbi:MAG TPA: VWA domain-containing protein [Thermoanaerobaculia bacterium]